MRVLIIDDDYESVATLKLEIEKRFAPVGSSVVSFRESGQFIESVNPHIIILDIMQGVAADNDAPGLKTREDIWQRKFCPLVIYTARPDLVEEDAQRNHPFFRVVTKGTGSEEKVLDLIRQYEPHVSALNDVNNEIHGALNRALKEVAPRVFESMESVDQRRDALTRFARRRVAALMDDALSSGGPNLRSWEQYLCPPTITGHLLTGDIIRKRTGEEREPTSYAIVLTPSCDLACEGKREAKVKRTLVALCKGVQRLLQDISLADRKNQEECKKRLRSILTQGHGHSCLPVPALPGVFPPMAADFRDLKLIDLSDIGDDREYVRVASVDNPFRELVAWAYVLNAARPGLPDRDFDSWLEEVFAALPESEKKPGQN